MTGADKVVVIAALIGLFGNLISSLWTIIASKKASQKQIDADLKSKARIEWIQNVRVATSELISLYHKILHETDKESVFDTYIIAREKNELLILFFGPENEEVVISDPKVFLLNKEDNIGKNMPLVNFLNDLVKKFYNYYILIEADIPEYLKKSYEKAEYNRIHYPGGHQNEDYIKHEGEMTSVDIPVNHDELIKESDEAKRKMINFGDYQGKLEEDLVFLRDVMRIYLKVEWRIAKQGK